MANELKHDRKKATVHIGELIEDHIDVLLKVASGDLPQTHVNGTIALLGDLKERCTTKAPNLTEVQAG